MRKQGKNITDIGAHGVLRKIALQPKMTLVTVDHGNHRPRQ
jgi:hypothetical protein